jgi:hypothetical protein
MLVRCEADKAKRRAKRNPNCRDCQKPLAFDDIGERMDMRIYCDPCLTKRKRSQDSRRIGAKPMADIIREAAERRARPITQELLKELFHYAPDTGVFTRLSTGKPAGRHKSSGGYIQIKVHGRFRMAHRLAWIYTHGEIPAGMEIDHKDQTKSCNKLSNLRLATRAQNQWNRGVSTDNALKIKGVYRRHNGYRTKIAIDGKQRLINDYRTPLAAWLAYRDAAIKVHGEFACLRDEHEVRELSGMRCSGGLMATLTTVMS